MKIFRIFILTIFIILLNTSLSFAVSKGFYIGGSVGTVIDNNIKVNNINQQKLFSDSNLIYNKELLRSAYDYSVLIISDATNNNTYSSILKEMILSRDNKLKPNAFSLSSGFAFKNFRIEGEFKNIALKIISKKYLYDIALQQDYKDTIASFCNINTDSISNSDRCKGDLDVDEKDPDYNKKCPLYSNRKKYYSCRVKNITINHTDKKVFNDVVIDNSGTPVFSTTIDKELSFANMATTTNNFLGFMNILYELPIVNNFTLFTGIGLGYGLMIIGDTDFINQQQIIYPAYQYKVGVYYSINSNIDITLNYSNINMIEASHSLISKNLVLADTNFQSVDIGLRYNFEGSDNYQHNTDTSSHSHPNKDYNFGAMFS